MKLSHECSLANDPEMDLRCPCGRLLVRLSTQGLILKCPRCKRVAVIALHDLQKAGGVDVVFSQ